MPLQTYDDLRNAVLAWPDLAGEQDLEGMVDTLISLGESRVYRDVRTRWNLGLVVGAVPDGTTRAEMLPTDFLMMDWVHGPSGESLEQRPSDELTRWGSEPSQPCVYAIDGLTLRFMPGVSSYSYQYYKRLPPLIDGSANALFTAFPGLFLYAALIEAAVFSKEPEQEMSRYHGLYQSIVGEVMLNEELAIVPRSQPIRTRVGRTGLKNRNS